MRGKRGRGASGKIIVFGLFRRGDQIYGEIVTTAKRLLFRPLFAVESQPML